MVGLMLIALASTPCEGGEPGLTFATCFDPWRGLELEGGLGASGEGFTGGFGAGLRLRSERESNSKAESTWLTLHHLGATTLTPSSGALALSVLGYAGLFRRHVREGVLLLPFTPPVRIPFPLDLAFLTEVLRYQRRWSEGSDWSFEPLRFSLLFDPLRQASSRFHLGFGPTVAWRMLQVDQEVLHEVTPLTAATLFFSFESENGLWLARGTLSGGWSLIAPDTALTLRARGEIELSRVLFALNDQPVSLFLKAGGAWRDAGARGGSEWSVLGGVQCRLFSARRALSD